MANVLNITYSGGTIDLQSSSRMHMDYLPSATPYIDGTETVSEAFRLRIIGSSQSNAQTLMQDVNKAFVEARRYNEQKQGEQVYLNYSLDGLTTYRTPLLDGQAVPEYDTTKIWQSTPMILSDVTLVRRNYWEGPETQVPLTNGNGTNDTSGLAVYNCNDGVGTSPTKRNNYVSVAGTAITGDLPALTRLEITNTFASSAKLYYLWIGQNWTDPGDFVPVLEAESATGASGTAVSTASGGYYVRTSVTTSETTVATWALDATFLNACKGNYYKALVFMGPITGDTQNYRFRLKVMWNTATIWQSGQVQPAALAIMIRDIATFRLPPWLPGIEGLDGINLVLTAQSTSGTQNLDVDYLMLLPVDGYRHLAYIGYGGATNRRIVDDGIRGFLYEDDGSGAGMIGNMIGYGQPIKLYPGKDQKLYFMMHSGTFDTASIAMSLGVKLFYRPRKISL